METVSADDRVYICAYLEEVEFPVRRDEAEAAIKRVAKEIGATIGGVTWEGPRHHDAHKMWVGVGRQIGSMEGKYMEILLSGDLVDARRVGTPFPGTETLK